ncbi:MAG: hypothetical protein RR937_03985 [Ruthenibacterium sp.]
MIRCFWQSKLVAVLGAGLTLGLTVWAVLYRAQQPIWIMGITAVLMLLLGLVVTKLLASNIATHRNQMMLAMLHLELAPQKFIDAYADVPAHTAPHSATHAVACSYLADGYCAAGNPSLALQTLTQDTGAALPKSKDALEGLYYHNQCNYYLHADDAEHAIVAAQHLQALINRILKENTPLALNLNADSKLFKAWIDFLNGDAVDTASLTEKLEAQPSKIKKLDTEWLLARVFAKMGNVEQARHYGADILENGGTLAIVAQARTLLEGLHASAGSHKTA